MVSSDGEICLIPSADRHTNDLHLRQQRQKDPRKRDAHLIGAYGIWVGLRRTECKIGKIVSQMRHRIASMRFHIEQDALQKRKADCDTQRYHKHNLARAQTPRRDAKRQQVATRSGQGISANTPPRLGKWVKSTNQSKPYQHKRNGHAGKGSKCQTHGHRGINAHAEGRNPARHEPRSRHPHAFCPCATSKHANGSDKRKHGPRQALNQKLKRCQAAQARRNQGKKKSHVRSARTRDAKKAAAQFIGHARRERRLASQGQRAYANQRTEQRKASHGAQPALDAAGKPPDAPACAKHHGCLAHTLRST